MFPSRSRFQSLIGHSVCVLWLAASALAAEAPPPNIVLPNIVLITVDTTRADRMGFLGSDRGLTPNLDALARESVVFTRAYSQAPLTAPSHATILTGTYPQFHQVSDFELPLGKDLPYVPAILKAHGYRTAAFLGAIVLDPSVLLAVGFDRGFDTYDAGFHEAAAGEDRYQSVERRGAEVVAHALAWLNAHESSEHASKQHPPAPFFIWVHLYDPHQPYDPPEPYKSKYASAPYDGEIAYADSAVGTLLSELRKSGLYDGSVIAVMADHGESLGAHGEESHGFFLYDETIHVPLLFKLPGEHFAGERIESRVGLVDVLPTILQTVGIAVPQEVQGIALLGMMTEADHQTQDHQAQDRPMYAETDYGHSSFGWSSLRSLRTGKYLFVEAPRRELYDQGANPRADHNLAPASKAVADTLEGQLDAFRQKTSSGREAPKSTANPEAQAKLAALGYMGSASGISAGSGDKIAGADPKDKIEIGNMIGHANFLLEDWKLAEAVPLLQQIIVKEPGMAMLYTKLGTAQLLLGNTAQAVRALRKVVELTPARSDAYFSLGNALMRAKDYEGAASQYKILAAKDPSYWEAHILLAMAYARMNRVPETIRECETVLAIDPEHYGSNLILGRFLLRQGHPEAALPRLQKAAALRPQAAEPHVALANAYLQLGRDADAAREREEAKHLQANPEPAPADPAR